MKLIEKLDQPEINVIPQSYASDLETIAMVADIKARTGLNKSKIHRTAIRDLWNKINKIETETPTN